MRIGYRYDRKGFRPRWGVYKGGQEIDEAGMEVGRRTIIK